MRWSEMIYRKQTHRNVNNKMIQEISIWNFVLQLCSPCTCTVAIVIPITGYIGTNLGP